MLKCLFINPSSYLILFEISFLVRGGIDTALCAKDRWLLRYTNCMFVNYVKGLLLEGN